MHTHAHLCSHISQELSTREQTNKVTLGKGLSDLEVHEHEARAAQDRSTQALTQQVDTLQGRLEKLRSDVNSQRLADISALKSKIQADVARAEGDLSQGMHMQVQGEGEAARTRSKALGDKMDLLRTSVYGRNKKLSEDVESLSGKTASDLQVRASMPICAVSACARVRGGLL